MVSIAHEGKFKASVDDLGLDHTVPIFIGK